MQTNEKSKATLVVSNTDERFRDVFAIQALVPLMRISRNFFLGRELTKKWRPFSYLDSAGTDKISVAGLAEIGVKVVDPRQLVGNMYGGAALADMDLEIAEFEKASETPKPQSSLKSDTE